MNNYFVSNGNFNPYDNNQQKELLSWLSKQPIDKIDDYVWQIQKPFYREKPVGWIQFLYDKNYMGNLFYNNGKSGLYPYWVDVGSKIYPTWFYQAYQLLLMSLAIGTGKSTFMNAIALYASYLLACLNNPAEYYGLLKMDIITMAFFSTIKDLVYDVNWTKYSEALTISPWWKNRLKLDDIEPKVKSLDLFEHFAVQLGTRTQHAISRDVLLAFIDEGNQHVTSDQVEKNFNELMKRRESRFQKGFTVPGIVVVGSSPQGPDDFIFRTIKRYEKDPTCLILNDISEWEVKKTAKQYCGKTFKLFIGDNKTQDAKILSSDEVLDSYDPTLLRDIPIEYYQEFETDLIGSIRDKLGLRSVQTAAWFKSRQSIAEVCLLPNLLNQDVIELSVFDSYKQIVELTNMDVLKSMLELGIPYFLGIDYGYNHDKFGFSLASSLKILKDEYYERQFIVPAAAAFKAKDMRGVPSKAFEQYIDWLSGEGLKIKLAVSDKPGTVTLQNLLIQGIDVKYYSVDTHKEPWEIIRTLIYSKHIKLPKNDLMVTEFSNVQDTGIKIDHPKTMVHNDRTIEGSKDTIDSIANSIYHSYINMPYETSETFLYNTEKMFDTIKQQQFINLLRQQQMESINNNNSNNMIHTPFNNSFNSSPPTFRI